MDRGKVIPDRCKHCGRQVYVNSIPIPNTNIKYILFNYPGGDLHECIVRPLNPWKKKLIKQFIGESTNNSSSNNESSEVVQRLNTVIEILSQIKENISYIER